MSAPLEPTPELLACARRVATREWTLGPDDSAYPDDPALRKLVDASYATVYYPPTRLRDDYWTLTTSGRAWLAEHGPETKETR
ncbi:hypothetical protein ABT369_39445 [Dactylosporangium sp. NPDC000244]|uniref:hypothetical protein n=1 Tax=Dactylosporangium sp. NPDC000244 TaxID=3154365 RepID=UPI0033240F64